jgi:ATP-dependent Clp protease ATP-binding subunit ClpA
LAQRLEHLEKQKAAEDAASAGGPDDVVTSARIEEVISRWSNIPVARLKATETQRLLQLERVLAKEVVGQPDATRAIANAIRLSRSGLASALKPTASFLFCGPSGVGKTRKLVRTTRPIL